jgi:hypothetical protein
MRNITTLGGDSLDSSDDYQRLIALHSVYVEKDQLSDIYASGERELTHADDYTSAWLTRIATANRLPESHTSDQIIE